MALAPLVSKTTILSPMARTRLSVVLTHTRHLPIRMQRKSCQKNIVCADQKYANHPVMSDSKGTAGSFMET
jgi:hypothetical protein